MRLSAEGASTAVVVAVGLGGNLGDPERAFAFALERLEAPLQRPRLSSLYLTSPVGGPPQPDYLNAAAVGRTLLAPLELLDLLLEVERAAGRDRRAARRDLPRPLDLDLLLYGDEVIDLPRLTVPHPRLAARRFVLAPLAELIPDTIVPGTGLSVGALALAAPASRVERLPRPA